MFKGSGRGVVATAFFCAAGLKINVWHNVYCTIIVNILKPKNMKKIYLILALAITTTVLTSCATVFTGSNKTVMIKSNVEAIVKMNGKEIGKTNQYIAIKRTNLIKLYQVEKDGCKTANYEFPVTINPAYYGNIPFMFIGIGIVGALWDAEMQNNWNTPKDHIVNLECDKK